MEHNCRICGGVRPHNGTMCLGCGASLRKCGQVAAKTAVNPVKCPTCQRANSVVSMDAGERFRCGWCSIVFEREDFGFVDDRPDVNAEKRERMAMMMKRRGSGR